MGACCPGSSGEPEAAVEVLMVRRVVDSREDRGTHGADGRDRDLDQVGEA